MSAHEQLAEDLALHALGSLADDEQAALEKHLQECAECRQELEYLRADMALLALSTPGPAPPRRARERLMMAVAREPRRKIAPQSRSWRIPLQWIAAAALAIVAAFLGRQNAGLKRQLSHLRSEFEGQQVQLQRAREVVETLTATDAMRVTLVVAKTPPQPQGKAFYLRGRGRLIFLASNLPPVPAQKTYELWLIPTTGAPVPAGVFQPDARGSATVIDPPLPVGLEAKAFAITVEPESGSSTPTMPIVMLGAGE
jgi:anti-sigma-K factor RskA